MRRFIVLLTLTGLIAALPATAGAAEHLIVSVDSNGTPASGFNEAIAMTPSGRYVVFASNADSLPGPNVEDVHFMLLYRRDLTTGVTRLVSRLPNGDAVPIQVEGDISSDGRYVTFTTDRSSSVGRGVYVRDLLRHETLLAGRVQQPLTASYWPQLSADGRRIAFVGFRRDSEQVYARDLVAERTRLLTPDADGRPSSNSWVGPPSISADGRYVAFEYEGDALPNCDIGAPKVYEWKTRTTTCAVSGWGADGPEYVNSVEYRPVPRVARVHAPRDRPPDRHHEARSRVQRWRVSDRAGPPTSGSSLSTPTRMPSPMAPRPCTTASNAP